MTELSTSEFLYSVLREVATKASMGAAYPSWSDKFARTEVNEAWQDLKAPLRRQRERKVTIEELLSLPIDTLHALGFGSWDGKLTLIPLWAWHYIADGEVLTSISGDTQTKGIDDIDLDVRFGCIAFGFLLREQVSA